MKTTIDTKAIDKAYRLIEAYETAIAAAKAAMDALPMDDKTANENAGDLEGIIDSMYSAKAECEELVAWADYLEMEEIRKDSYHY